MSEQWITLHVCEDTAEPYANYRNCQVDIRPSHILCMVELKYSDQSADPEMIKLHPATSLTLNQPDDAVIETAESTHVARSLRTIAVVETLDQIRALLNR